MILTLQNRRDFAASTFRIEEGFRGVFGREPRCDPGQIALKVPWPDRMVNGMHAEVRFENGQLALRSYTPEEVGKTNPRNPFFEFDPATLAVGRRLEQNPITLAPRQFVAVAGEKGHTILGLDEPLDRGSSEPAAELEKDIEKLIGTTVYRDLPYSVRTLLDLVVGDLPGSLTSWNTPEEAYSQAAYLIEKALGHPAGVRAIFIEPRRNGVLNPENKPHDDFAPSSSVVKRILETASFVPLIFDRAPGHVLDMARSLEEKLAFIVGMALDSPAFGDSRRVVLYLHVPDGTRDRIEGSVPLITLICKLLSGLLEAGERRKVQDQLSRYFSPSIYKQILSGADDLLEPRIADCTVLFCDRRGSSSEAEDASDDSAILKKLNENKALLEKITPHILKNGGAIADFAGDAVVGFWGWPAPSEERKHAWQAVQAARDIVETLKAEVKLDSRAGLRFTSVRIGISTGTMAAGNIGPEQQMKIGVSGNPVNFGSRLEGLGKTFRVPIVISEKTADLVRGRSGALLRKLALMKPTGFQKAYPIFELVVPRECGGSGASEETVRQYEEALACFTRGEFAECREKLHVIPFDDEPKQWLHAENERFRTGKSTPPPGWQGEIISLEK